MATIPAREAQLKNGERVLIRTAEASDAEKLLALSRTVMADSDFLLTEPDEFDLTLDQEITWIENHRNRPSKIILVAEAHRQIVGIIDFSNGHRRRISHTGEFGMAVAADWRGRGVGASLLESLLNWARENPTLEKVNLRVHSTNDRAIALYKKFGFEVEGRLRNDLKFTDNRYVDTLIMGVFVKP